MFSSYFFRSFKLDPSLLSSQCLPHSFPWELISLIRSQHTQSPSLSSPFQMKYCFIKTDFGLFGWQLFSTRTQTVDMLSSKHQTTEGARLATCLWARLSTAAQRGWAVLPVAHYTWTDGWMEGWTDGRMDRQTDRLTDWLIEIELLHQILTGHH